MLPIDFLAGARRDLDESLEWYAARSPMAAARFVSAIERTLVGIATDPGRFSPVDDTHRQCPVKRFPFRVVFRVAGNRVVIVAIAHASRRPGYWQRRSKPE
jgi:plasmid stabilization system protein ParE